MTLGIIAGGGNFPILAARHAKAKGSRVISVGFETITSPTISEIAHKHLWIKLGEFSKLLRYFKSEGVQAVLMAGTVDHGHALKPWDALKAMSDLRTIKMLLTIKEKKTKPILEAVIAEIEKEGMRVLPSFCYLESELLKPGILAGNKPGNKQQEEIGRAFKIAKEIAGLDIGLTVCVRHGAVLAVEALEGTDACIERAGSILRTKSSSQEFIVVKVARPNQDPRYDLPVIGPKTIETIHRAGGKILAAEAGWTLILDKEQTIALANQHKITILGLNAQ